MRSSLLWAWGWGCWVLAAGCAPNFASNDLSALVRERSAFWPTFGASAYSPYTGYGTDCPHNGAHLYFNDTVAHPIFAVTSGVITGIRKCIRAGEHDKFEITLAIGNHGAVPVYFVYGIEPYGGRPCSGDGGDSSYFRRDIFVNVGSRVRKGDEIARIFPVSTGAHLHMTLRADGTSICPEIFPVGAFGTVSGPIYSTCGTTVFPQGTFCYGLTPSEDPSGRFL